MSDGLTELLAGVPAATRADWERAAEETLRGRPLAKLDVTTADGIVLAPLYAPDAAAPARRPLPARGDGPWDIRTRVVEPDPEAANAAVLEDLEGGATSVEVDAAVTPVHAAGATTALLAGVLTDLAAVTLRPATATTAAAEALLAALPGTARAGLGLDPLGAGTDPGSAVALAVSAAGSHPDVRSLAADGVRWANAGATDALQVACVLAGGVEYLRLLTDAGLDMSDAFGGIVLHVAAGTDQFATIATIRALRRAWSRVGEACGAEAAAAATPIHATLPEAVVTARDPWVNLLRGTMACFAAAAGGADGVTVLPFDSAVGRPDRLGRRLARNTQLMLQEETGLHLVADPAGGSWFVETFTDALANRAWELFQRFDEAGGLSGAISSGLVTAPVDQAWLDRSAAIARRAQPITGVSEFPDLSERALHRDPSPETAFVRRWSAPFERLRDAADRAEPRPAVRLHCLGPLSDHSARAAFASNLFAAGGIATTDDPSPLACICGTDEAYAVDAARAAAELRAAGAAEVWLAGRAEVEGVDHHIAMGGDAVASLERAHRVLEVSP